MSQIAPDIPELEGVPEVLRGGIWMQAYLRAIRSWLTLALGAALAIGLGVSAASAATKMFGTLAAIVAGTGGAVLGLILWIRYVIEWRARRMVPTVRAEAGYPMDGRSVAKSERPPRD